MNESVLQRIVQRSNRNLLLLSLLGIVAVAALALLNTRYYYNFFLGPFTTTPQELLAVSSPSSLQNYWIQIRGEELINTGYQYVTTTNNNTERVDDSYFALVVDEQLLLVKIPGNHEEDTLDPTVTGWVTGLSTGENKNVIQPLIREVPEVADAFLSYKLESGNFRTGGIIGIVAGVVVLGLCAWGLLQFARRRSDPFSHPALKPLARFGPLEFIIGRIESEMAGEHPKLGNLHLTNTWAVYADAAHFKATRYEDIAWLYKHVTTQRYYGIPVSKTYAAMVYDRHGVQMVLAGGRKEPLTDEMLHAIARHAPWAMMGFSKELEQAWKNDQAGFLASVEQNKAQLQAEAA